MPSLSQVKVTDFFHRLVSRPVLPPTPHVPLPFSHSPVPVPGCVGQDGVPDRSGVCDCHSASPPPLVSSQGPLSVFSTKNRWQLVGPVHMTRGEEGFGFTLRGDSPVLIAAVVPGGQAEVKAH